MYILEDEFISVRLALLAMVYPDVELCAYIYSSSGHVRKYNTYKISVHIVYNIVVDEERAAKLRQHCVENLTFLSERCHNEGFDEDTDPSLAPVPPNRDALLSAVLGFFSRGIGSSVARPQPEKRHVGASAASSLERMRGGADSSATKMTARAPAFSALTTGASNGPLKSAALTPRQN